MSTSDGSTADYYELPAGATELQDLISHRNLNAQDGEIFRAIYRKGRASHSDELRDARKVLFYAQAEVKRLEKLATVKESLTVHPVHPATFDHIDPADVEIASAIDDDSERMQAIGQNGEMASEVYAAVDGWVLWNGGERPVMDGTLIDTRHRDGELWLGSVCGQYGTRTAPMFWTHTGDKAEVIAYRLHVK